MDPRGVKAIQAASDATVLSAVESRQDTGIFGGGEGNGGQGKGRKNLRKYTPRSAYDGSTARSPHGSCGI